MEILLTIAVCQLAVITGLLTVILAVLSGRR